MTEQKEILAKIASTGNVPSKFGGKIHFLKGLQKYFTEYYGSEFQECAQESLISLYEYHDQTQMAATRQFRKAMRHFHMNESVCSFNGGDSERIISTPMLLFISMNQVGTSIQAKILQYVKNGGILCVFGPFPELGDAQEPCSILKDEFSSALPQKMPSSHPKHNRKINSPQIGKSGKGFILHWMNNPIFKRNNSILGQKLSARRISKNNHTTVLTLNKLFRFLQLQGITRNLEASLRTDYIFRHKIETSIYIHPDRDIFHIFLFNLDPKLKLPVSLHLFHPKRNISVRIRTNILGNTAMLMRIEEGVPTAIIYTGVHHRSREPLFLKINSSIITTNSPIDIIALKNSHAIEIFAGETRPKIPSIFKGFTSEPVSLHHQTHIKLD